VILELLTLGQLYQPPAPKNKPLEIKPQYITVELIEPIQAPQYVIQEKLSYIATTPITRTRTTQNSSSGHYQRGQCTAFVASKRYVPNGWGNATKWKSHAERSGWTVSRVPVIGAIGWTYGHVVYVISVQATTVTISEQNYDYKSSIRTIDVPISKYTYLY